jgi:hypothetical protein
MDCVNPLRGGDMASPPHSARNRELPPLPHKQDQNQNAFKARGRAFGVWPVCAGVLAAECAVWASDQVPKISLRNSE